MDSTGKAESGTGIARFGSWWRRRPRGEAGRGSAAPSQAERRDLLLSAVRAGFAAAAPAAHPVGYRCSCDRIGCPTPARHPVSFAWQTQASTDVEQVEGWLDKDPQANLISATGLAHDVLDVPAAAGRLALERLALGGGPAGAAGQAVGVGAAGPDPALATTLAPAPASASMSGPGLAELAAGPVAAVGEDRYLFFTATRGTPDDEDEWWPCELDCHPETLDEHPGLRWHCRGSYVLLPGSELLGGERVTWVRGPEHPLPDPLRLLDVLTDACAEVGASAEEQWLIR